MSKESMMKGMSTKSPSSTDPSTGKSGSPGGSVNDSPTRSGPPKVIAPGTRTA